MMTMEFFIKSNGENIVGTNTTNDKGMFDWNLKKDIDRDQLLQDGKDAGFTQEQIEFMLRWFHKV